jgi:hypothetical protein
MYSLVNAPVLGFDLVRLPGGPALAALLLTAGRLDEAGLAVVGRYADDAADRATAWLDLEQAAAARRRAKDLLASAAGTPRADEAAAEAASELPDALSILRSRQAFLAKMLEQAPLGTLDGLLTCIREEIFAWAWRTVGDRRATSDEADRGLTVVCDAAAALYLAGNLPPATARTLLAPWEAAMEHLGTAYGHAAAAAGEDVDALLRRVQEAGPVEMRRLAAAGERWRLREPSWAGSVHDATWALTLTDRLRDALAAQLLLVRAVRAGTWTTGSLAGGDWNVLSGAVQVLLVRDVVPSTTTHRLLAPFVEAFGPLAAADRRAAG